MNIIKAYIILTLVPESKPFLLECIGTEITYTNYVEYFNSQAGIDEVILPYGKYNTLTQAWTAYYNMRTKLGYNDVPF